jgi:formate dehydrogenase major subunit/formate dehydrogenase alpha subunit
MEYEGPQDIMQEIAETVPSYAGINYERLDNDGIPCPSTAEGTGTPRLHVDKFMCGQGALQAVEYTPPETSPNDQYPLYLTTGRDLYQFHTATRAESSEGRLFEPVVEISIEDAVTSNVGDGDTLKIASSAGEIQMKALVSEKAMKGIVFIPLPFAAPLDPEAETLGHKPCTVKIEKV